MTWCIERKEIATERLLLRPLQAGDAEAVQSYVGLWEVARMTSRIPHPYPEGAAAEWIDTHHKEREQGREYILAIALKTEPGPGPGFNPAIGATSLRNKHPGTFELGYWLAPGCWGCGLATEAAQAMVTYGFEELNAKAVHSGHFADNPASGRVLVKCGFQPTGDEEEWSAARQDFVACKRFVLERAVWQSLDLAS